MEDGTRHGVQKCSLLTAAASVIAYPLPPSEVTETHDSLTTELPVQAFGKGQSKSSSGSWPDAIYKPTLTPSKRKQGHLRSRTTCDLLDSHPILFITIPVQRPRWVDACKAFVPQTRSHTAHFLAECLALGTFKILPTSSMEPTLPIKLPSRH